MAKEAYPRVYLYRRIVQAKLFIDNNFAQSIDLNNIADEAYFSKFHFIRIFKKAYGKTPHQYLTQVRIEKAMQLLINGKQVSECCYSVGFESLSSFTGLFKRIAGATPSAFLEEQQRLKEEILAAPLRFIPGCYAYQNGWSARDGEDTYNKEVKQREEVFIEELQPAGNKGYNSKER